MNASRVDTLRTTGLSRQVRFRVDPTEEAGFRQAARLSGLSLSAWVRIVLREAAERRIANSGGKAPWVK